jgi:hypothetical protein
MTTGSSAVKAESRDADTRRGEIHSETIPGLFHELGREEATGTLVLTRDRTRKTVDFDKGLVLFASSNDRDDRLNQILLRAEVISLKDLMQGITVALATRDRLGEVLVRSRLMKPGAVDRWVKVQLRQIIYTLFAWTEGHFEFEAGPVQHHLVSLLMSGDAMVLEGVRSLTSWARVYEEVGGLNTEYLATGEMPRLARELPLLKEERQLLQMCKTPTSLEEMCESSGMKDYDICKSVWALLLVGALMKS